ncbi:MAG TPA: ChbG/HpnK family deacetylase, partial [Gammaproteobacteria bacterium]|nr:ChbG/HpnK family deacetylase [Gammaproteobacteria bacterium]
MTRAAGGARLIVNADDFGLSEAVNRAVIQAHENGIVTSTSIMAGGVAFEHAAGLAARCPTLGVGVHLTLTEQRPLIGAAAAASLVDADGKFAPHLVQFASLYVRGKVNLA